MHRLREIGGFCDRQVRQGAGRSACNRVREAGRAPLGDDYAVCAGSKRRSNDSAKIVRILDAVKQDDETFLTVARAGVGGGEDVLDRGCGARSSERDDALMIFRTREAIALGAILEAPRDVPTPPKLDDLLTARILPPPRVANPIEPPPASATSPTA